MLRRSRSIPVLIVGLIVFAFTTVLATPAGAAAVSSGTLYGGKANVDSDSGIDIRGVTVSMKCSGAGYWVATKGAGSTTTAYSMKYTVQCTGLFVSVFAPATFRVTGVNDQGTQCSRAGSSTRTSTGTMRFEERGTISLGTSTTGAAGADGLIDLVPGLSGVCNPTRGSSSASGGGVWSAPLSLGKRPAFADAGALPTGSTCSVGTPQSVQITPEYGGLEPWWRRYKVTVKFTGPVNAEWTMDNRIAVAPKTKDTWAIGDPLSSTGHIQGAKTLVGQDTWTFTTGYLNKSGDDTDPVTKLLGVRLYSPGGLSNDPRFAGSKAGRTAPALCHFWVGKKIYNDDATLEDDPWGSLDEPVETGLTEPPIIEPAEPLPLPEDLTEPEEACNFDLSDPGSWLSGGMCSAVGLLGRIVGLLLAIWDGIVGLPAAIIDAIGAVFVPAPGVLEGHMTGVRDAWSESSPGEYFTAFGSVANAARFESSGCAGPSFNFSMPGGFGATQTVQPMNACSGGVATVAGVVKAGLTLTAYIGAALVALRVLGSAFGLNLNGVGAGRDD